MSNIITSEIKIPPLEWPIASMKAIRYCGRVATCIPTSIVDSKGWTGGTILEQQPVELPSGLGILVKESETGKVLHSYANGSYVMQFERKIAKLASIVEEKTELGFYIVLQGIVLQPRMRRWSIRV